MRFRRLAARSRLLARDGLNPKFSPDGSQVAYWVGSEDVVRRGARGTARSGWYRWPEASRGVWGRVSRLPAIRSGPRTGSTCYSWVHIDEGDESSGLDWWLVTTNGGEAVKTGVYDALVRAGLKATNAVGASIPRPGWFASDQTGPTNIWMRELATGKESSVAGSSFTQRYPVINASGARIAFSAYEKDKRIVYVSAPGGAPEKLCEGCLRATDWSNDEKTLLMFGGSPYQVDVLDLASHRQTPLLKHPTYNLLYARFSPDNRWVSFTARIQPNRGRIADRASRWTEAGSRKRVDHHRGGRA